MNTIIKSFLFDGLDCFTEPKINSYSEEGNIVFDVFYPGAKKENFKLSYDDGILVIKGEFEEKNEKKQNYLREYTHTNFQRRFALPDEIKKKEIKASYEDGILKVVVPIDKKKEQERKFAIDIS
jgi:HSP20 family protein